MSADESKGATPEPETPDEDRDPHEEELGPKMSFIDHLEELRRRLIISILTVAICTLVVYGTSIDTVSLYFLKPIKDALAGFGHFQYTAMAEKFIFELKLAVTAGIFVSLPMLFYQFWAFVAPGLYKKERRLIGPLILFSTFFFVAGASFFYFVVFPFVAKFFVSFAQADWIQFNPKFSETFSFVLILTVAFGGVFEMPLVVFVLAKLGIVSSSFLNKNRKYAIILIFIMGAVFTPPDVVSQLMLAFPMWLLFEISVLVAYIFGPKKKPPEPEEEAESSSQ